jgi:hypothetical protein
MNHMTDNSSKFNLLIMLLEEEFRIFQKTFVIKWLTKQNLTFCIASKLDNPCN